MKQYKKEYSWFFVCYLLVTLLSARIQPSPRPSPEENRLLFLKATQDNQTIYLFGTIGGAFQPNLGYPLPDRVLNALDASDHYLYSPESDTILDQIPRRNQAWSEVIGNQEAENLQSIIHNLPITSEMKEYLLDYHPWMVAQILYQVIAMSMGFDATPEEIILYEHATRMEIPTTPLEILPLELSFLHTISETYPKELYQWAIMYLVLMDSGVNLAQVRQNAWLEGDIMTILDQLVISRTPQFDLLHPHELQLYDNINQSIWQSIQQVPKNHAITLFLALPAEYLLDEGGFASFLEENNFTITRS